MTFLGLTTGLRPSHMRPLPAFRRDVRWQDRELLVWRSHTMGDEIMETTKTKRRCNPSSSARGPVGCSVSSNPGRSPTTHRVVVLQVVLRSPRVVLPHPKPAKAIAGSGSFSGFSL
jgi:hypothetical protein